MSKLKYPITPAIRMLRENNISYEPYLLSYQEHGGTALTAQELGENEHLIIKTIVLTNEENKGLIVLMHGDREISTRNLARTLHMKHIEPASVAQAQKWTGYLFGGTSPFGIKTSLPIYVEETIFSLPYFFINGGKRGFQVKITPADLLILQPKKVQVAV